MNSRLYSLFSGKFTGISLILAPEFEFAAQNYQPFPLVTDDPDAWRDSETGKNRELRDKAIQHLE